MGKLSKRRKVETDEEKIIRVADAAKMNVFFHQVWDERADKDGNCYCYETGARLSWIRYKNNHGVYHHVLPKETYPQYKYCAENIQIITLDSHSQVHTNSEKTPKLHELIKVLKQRHQDGTLCTEE